jgi:hypothetical protein
LKVINGALQWFRFNCFVEVLTVLIKNNSFKLKAAPPKSSLYIVTEK